VERFLPMQPINPIWRRIGEDCNLNRKIDDLIRSAGFEISEVEMKYASHSMRGGWAASERGSD